MNLNNETKKDDNSENDVFSKYYQINLISAFSQISEKIDTKWVFVCNLNTSISPNYANHIINSLKDFPPSQLDNGNIGLLIGRFSCIPTKYLENLNEFKLCYKYPILESGFLISSFIFKKFLDYIIDKQETFKADKIEILLGLYLETTHTEFAIIDDFRFSYLPANSYFRPSLFLASFNQKTSSSLSLQHLHASGVRFKNKISPFAEGEVILGFGVKFNGTIFPFDSHIKLSCFEETNMTEKIKYPPYHYADVYNVKIQCY